MKKLVFPLILTVLLCFILTGCIVDATTTLPCTENVANIQSLTENTDASHPTTELSAPSMAAGKDTGIVKLSNITNIAIFICFADEDRSSLQAPISANIIDMFNGERASLRDYYQAMSYNKLTIDTIFPKNPDNSYFIYQAPLSRKYYADIRADSGPSRTEPESTLLNAAVVAANNKLDFASYDLDGNGDSYIDMVSFVISGSQTDTDWGGLLWPHAWSLDPITSSTKFSSAKLNDICVNEFSVTFVDSYKVGYICHEIGHILGMPDLYHYTNDKDHYPAGYWDLMHLNCNIPQFTTTYLRHKYLSFVDESQVGNLTKNGTYTLKPTTTAKQNDILAYRIYINDHESIWIEYRNNSVSDYDAELSGSGLIVYRINNKVTGNENGRYQNTNYPDEVFVFRPYIISEIVSINNAYVSTTNEHFSKIGIDANNKLKYNQSAIYLTNGTNTGIIITPTIQDENNITFTAYLGEYDQSNIVDIKVFDQPYSMFFGDTPSPNVRVKYKENISYLPPFPSRLSYIYDANVIGQQTATVTYMDENNTLSTTFQLIIKDKIDIDGISVLERPYITEYDIGDTLDLAGLVLKITSASGIVSYKEYKTIYEQDWTFEGVDFAKSGTYSVKVSYLPLNIYVYLEIKVLSCLVGITVLDKDTLPIFLTNKLRKLNVVGVNSDGSYRKLESHEYRLGTYDANKLWQKQVLTITHRDNPSFSCLLDIYVVDGNPIRINVTKPTIKDYTFGSKLNLAGGFLRFEYIEGQTVTIPMESYFSSFNEVFSPDKVGEQSLTVNIQGYNATIVVKVMSQSSSLISVTTNEISNINITGTTIYLKQEYTLKQLESAFMSYLDISFVKDNNLIINSNSYPNLKVGSGVKLILSNGDKTISTYAIVLMGDTNGDGQFNNLDVSGLITAIMNERTNLLYLDINNDGAYTLTDFVLWIGILEAK